MMNGPKVDASYLRALSQLRLAITQNLETDKLHGPALLRLAVHDATTYVAKTNESGANGSIRTKKELEQPGNEGLEPTVDALVSIKSDFPNITNADLIQLAAVVAVQHMGGPFVALTPGRKDSWTFPPPGRLFSPGKGSDSEAVTAVRQFANRTGLLLRAVVALMGAASVGRWWGDQHKAEAGPSALRFSNNFFRSLVDGHSPADGWLLTDDELRMYCEEYAIDQKLFFKDYAVAHEEMSRLGTRLQPTTAAALAAAHAADATLWDSITPAQAAAVAAVLGAVVAVGVSYWWSRRRRLRRIV